MVYQTETLLSSAKKQLFEIIFIIEKIFSFCIIVNDRFPVINFPGRVANRGLAYFLEVFSFNYDRNCKPEKTILGFNFVAIPPIPAGKLHIIIQNKFIYKVY